MPLDRRGWLATQMGMPALVRENGKRRKELMETRNGGLRAAKGRWAEIQERRVCLMNGGGEEVGASDTHLILTARRGVWCRWTVEVGGGSVPKEKNKQPRCWTHGGGVACDETACAQATERRRVGRGTKSKREQEPRQRLLGKGAAWKTIQAAARQGMDDTVACAPLRHLG